MKRQLPKPNRILIVQEPMPANTAVIDKINTIVDKYESLQKLYGFPIKGAIFDCLKAAQKPDGTIPQDIEVYIEQKLNYPVLQQRRVRSFYDMISKDIPGGASGKAAEALYHRFVGAGTNGEAWKVKLAGQLLENFGPKSHLIEDYLSHGGYEAVRKALKMSQEEIIAEVEKSGLQGRGGAYFPAAIKWKDAMQRKAEFKFLVCNADEGEPPTCKDKALMDFKPHQLIEGMIITGKAIGAHLGIIYIRGDYFDTIDRLNNAIEEAKKNGLLGKDIAGSGFTFDIIVFAGSGSYVAGCSGAMVESIEGKPAIPRSKQFRLTQDGINHQPTVVNNVESLSNVTLIIKNGGEAFAKIGSPNCPGTKLFNLCGDIANPGIYELPTNVTLRELIEKYGGGVIETDLPAGRQGGNTVKKGKLKAVSPGGATTALLSAEEIDITMDSKSLRDARSSLGSGAVAVFNTTRNIREYSQQVMEFLAEESCAKCMQCPLIIGRTLETLEAIGEDEEKGAAGTKAILAAKNDPKPLNCELGKGCLNTVISAIKKFPKDFGVKGATNGN